MLEKFMVIGDLHIRETNPVSRLDNYEEAIQKKLQFLIMKAQEEKHKAVILLGDIFDTPKVGYECLLRTANTLSMFSGKLYIVNGNHDIYNYSMETVTRTAIYMLSRICHNVVVCHTGTENLIEDKLDAHFYGFSEHVDKVVDGVVVGYEPSVVDLSKKNVAFGHVMLLSKDAPYKRKTLIEDLPELPWDYYFAGHNHTGWGEFKFRNTVYVNYGAICRKSASEEERSRDILACTLVYNHYNDSLSLEVFDVPHASGEEVLTRSHLLKKEITQDIQAEFIDVIESEVTGQKYQTVKEFVEDVAEKFEVDKEVRDNALHWLNVASAD